MNAWFTQEDDTILGLRRAANEDHFARTNIFGSCSDQAPLALSFADTLVKCPPRDAACCSDG